LVVFLGTLCVFLVSISVWEDFDIGQS